MRLPAIAVMLTVLAMLISPVAAAVRSVTVENTVFRIVGDDGRVMPQDALKGVILTMGDGSGKSRQIRIDAVDPDPTDPAREVMLYTFSAQTGANGAWENICLAGPDGAKKGFPLNGAFTKDMRHVDRPGRILITCTGGAEGKCIRFGYKPWRTAPDGSSLAPYYQTCVRLVRADYCGDGVGHTRNGTPIDIFDRIGIQRDETAPGMSFEAAFGPDGAICVAHPRLPDEITLGRLSEICPRLAGHVGPACAETAEGLLFVRSYGR